MREDARCPYCLADLLGDSSGEPLLSCRRCLTPHHEGCFLEHGRCTIFGCGGVETTRLVSLRPGDFRAHPFLPVGGATISRAPSFLLVQEDQLRTTPSAFPQLRLSVPTMSRCGQPLVGHVDLALSHPARAYGVRLCLEAVLPRPCWGSSGTSDQSLYREEAVLAGVPRRSWLERIRSWRRREHPPLRISAGRTRYHLQLDPGLLHWRGPLPDHGDFGPWHALRAWVELDSPQVPLGTRVHRVLVRHSHARCEPGSHVAARLR